MAVCLSQTAQGFHVLDIFEWFLSLRCFENFWDFSKSSIAHDETKCIEANLSLADVFVTIDPRTTRGFRVVQVQRDEMLQPNCPVEFPKHFLRSRFAR